MKEMGTLRDFRCRAECVIDVEVFRRWAEHNNKPLWSGETIQIDVYPDVEWDFTSTASLRELRQWTIVAADDLHVMRETMQLRERYTGVRRCPR